MYTIGGYSVLGWNHPGFGGSTVRSAGVKITTFIHQTPISIFHFKC